ncbi:hypothetical protein XELAEV_18015106mg [Xenopus laevis]|uniref:Uncharacterized protein n=1 Tax=Xenopus laevis TaxID=8355 RepID=A0A974DHE2_XENLA|nr:hypothetical protein XELAEV_18015106mg [Xenopus laevis]
MACADITAMLEALRQQAEKNGSAWLRDQLGSIGNPQDTDVGPLHRPHRRCRPPACLSPEASGKQRRTASPSAGAVRALRGNGAPIPPSMTAVSRARSGATGRSGERAPSAAASRAGGRSVRTSRSSVRRHKGNGASSPLRVQSTAHSENTTQGPGGQSQGASNEPPIMPGTASRAPSSPCRPSRETTSPCPSPSGRGHGSQTAAAAWGHDVLTAHSRVHDGACREEAASYYSNEEIQEKGERERVREREHYEEKKSEICETDLMYQGFTMHVIIDIQ